MIIVRLAGGLGNQMFQYAAARRLASVHRTELKLDLSSLRRDSRSDTPREYELRHFNITADIATPAEIARILGSSSGSIGSALARLGRRVGLTKPNPHRFKEKLFHFDRALLDAPDNTHLDGYWQSEKYFRDIEEVIRGELTVRSPLEGENHRLAQKIMGTTSVSVHVRRGDYLSNPAIRRIHPVCGPEYYRTCIDLLQKKVPDPHFYLFSDEPDWAESNLELRLPTTIIRHNGPRKSHEDLRLMSLCRHHIIANSSFSWWGAWLNNRREKTVLAPGKWFNDPEINTGDLIPDGWITL